MPIRRAIGGNAALLLSSCQARHAGGNRQIEQKGYLGQAPAVSRLEEDVCASVPEETAVAAAKTEIRAVGEGLAPSRFARIPIRPRDNESQAPMTWEQVAAEIRKADQILCVVSKRDDARQLYELIRAEPGAVHLSALMCGDHRAEVIARVKQDLKAGKPVRLVSTQLVEAGVDLDFPVVFRAFAGLDSIAQAAGRCNREGRLPQPGRVVVFNPPTPPPLGLLRKAESKTRELLAGRENEYIDPSLFSQFFELLYKQGVNSLDKHGILNLVAREGDARNLDISPTASIITSIV